MRLVIVESPYAGDFEANIAYAREAMADSLRRGEAPFLSHLLYPQVLNDLEPMERLRGIEAGLCWGSKAEATVAYVDLGVTPGMDEGMRRARREGRRIEIRRIR